MRDQEIQAVFSDVDGTLLNSKRCITPRTLQAIRRLGERDIPFVIISARSPSGIAPILREYDLSCPVICYSGGLILSESGEALWEKGLTASRAQQVITHLEACHFDMSICLYSYDDWMVAEREDPRIQREEQIVQAWARQVDFSAIPGDTAVHKVLCICAPAQTDAAEKQMKVQFPDLTVVRSSEILLEIMAQGVDKAAAVETLGALWDIPMRNIVAFGDNYNDAGMLEAVGHGFLMRNAPEPLLARIPRITEDNDHDGIAEALQVLFPEDSY